MASSTQTRRGKGGSAGAPAIEPPLAIPEPPRPMGRVATEALTRRSRRTRILGQLARAFRRAGLAGEEAVGGRRG